MIYLLPVFVFMISGLLIPDDSILFNDTLRKQWLDSQVELLKECIKNNQCLNIFDIKPKLDSV